MSDAAQTSREAVIARIRNSSKDAVVLEEMRRLGFWPQGQASPGEGEVAALIEQEAALIQELQQINRNLARVRDPQAALLEMKKERMAAAKRRREETRQRHAQLRYQRATAWHARMQQDIVYLGAGVSAGLDDARHDTARLASKQLPLLDGPQALAAAMGVPLAELRFLAYHRSVSRISHYRRFGIAKKTGGVRLISAPMPRLKRAQYWVLDRILARLPLHEAAHGFVPGRSIVGNALPHVGRAVVLNLDLQNFFPSIAYPRVRGLFQSFGYSRQMATLLALICTETPSEEVELDGNRYHVQTGERCLPQGAPSSPAITNLLCRRLDKRLTATAAKLGFSYTRYADDMTFSADAPQADGLARLLWRVKRIIADEGFTLHPDKQRIMRAASRQEVTGVVVNRQPAICRDTLRRFRATMFQVEKDGPLGKQWNGNSNVIAALEGYARFIAMVDPAKGEPLCQRAALLRAKWGSVLPAPASTGYRRAFRAASAEGRQTPGRIWLPAERPVPQLEQTDQQQREQRAAAREAAQPSPVPQTTASRANATPPAAQPQGANPAAIGWVQQYYGLLAVGQFMALLAIGVLGRFWLLPLCGLVLMLYALRTRHISGWHFALALVVGILFDGVLH
ncbi:MAG: RNA-directed DNA polymerase [Chitinimonas sp.]|nr:RNA-directed DNA polymerase [Chitinimonas sp.]